MKLARAVDLLFLATLFTATFTQLERAEIGLKLFDVLGLLFVAAHVVERLFARDVRLRLPEAALLLVAATLLVVYLAGAAGLESHWSRVQFAKGLGRFLIHFAVLIAAVSYLARRPPRFYSRALAALCAGIGVNAAYGAAQLAAAKAGLELDAVALEPLTGRPARTLEYGFSYGPHVERARGLTSDPNHLGVMLLVPLLVVLPLSLRLESRRWRRGFPLALAFLLLVGAATMSRSAVLGLATGIAVLAWRYRGALVSRGLVAAVAAAAACLALVVARDPGFYGRVVSARVDLRSQRTGQTSHLEVYEFVPRALDSNPLVGIGLNNFAPFTYPVTGRRDYGPLSLYGQLLIETGLVGTVVFVAFLGYCALRLRAAHALAGRRGLEAPPWFHALIWGLAAAFVATMVANAFYLTVTFAYFYVFLALVVMASAPLGNGLKLGEGTREELRVAPGGVLASDVGPAAPTHRE